MPTSLSHPSQSSSDTSFLDNEVTGTYNVLRSYTAKAEEPGGVNIAYILSLQATEYLAFHPAELEEPHVLLSKKRAVLHPLHSERSYCKASSNFTVRPTSVAAALGDRQFIDRETLIYTAT